MIYMKTYRIPIIKEILEKQNEILENIKQESVAVYLFLKNEYKKGDIINNNLFQFVFRSYYRLDGAGLSEKQKVKYFQLLAKKEDDLKIILNILYKLSDLNKRNAIQFSFATKLLHTIDNSKPIFDAEVSRVFCVPRRGKTKKEKIIACLSIYEFLKNTYSDLLLDKEIIKLIVKFRSKFKDKDKNISDIKVLDFIIWSLGKIKNK